MPPNAFITHQCSTSMCRLRDNCRSCCLDFRLIRFNLWVGVDCLHTVADSMSCTRGRYAQQGHARVHPCRKEAHAHTHPWCLCGLLCLLWINDRVTESPCVCVRVRPLSCPLDKLYPPSRKHSFVPRPLPSSLRLAHTLSPHPPTHSGDEHLLRHAFHPAAHIFQGGLAPDARVQRGFLADTGLSHSAANEPIKPRAS